MENIVYSVGQSYALRSNPSDFYTIIEILGTDIITEDALGDIIEVQENFFPEVFIVPGT